MKVVKFFIDLVREGFKGNIATVYKVFLWAFNILCLLINVVAVIGIPAIFFLFCFGNPAGEQLILILYGCLIFIVSYALMGVVSIIVMLSESNLKIQKLLQPVKNVNKCFGRLKFETDFIDGSKKYITEKGEQNSLLMSGSGSMLFSEEKINREVKVTLCVSQIAGYPSKLSNQVGGGFLEIGKKNNNELSIDVYTDNIDTLKNRFLDKANFIELYVDGEYEFISSETIDFKIMKYTFFIK